MKRLLVVLLPLFLAVSLTSCSSTREPKAQWQRLEVRAPSDQILWKVANMSVNRRGFPRGKLDLAGMEIESAWRNDMAPFRGEGFRTKAHVKMRPVEPGTWMIEARVTKQVNHALTRQLSVVDADWEWVPDDVSTARILLQHIRALLPDEIDVTEPVDPIDLLLERADRLENGSNVGTDENSSRFDEP